MSAQEETTDLYAVIDLLTDKVGRQLKKHVEKVKAKKSRSPSTREVLAPARKLNCGSRACCARVRIDASCNPTELLHNRFHCFTGPDD